MFSNRSKRPSQQQQRQQQQQQHQQQNLRPTLPLSGLCFSLTNYPSQRKETLHELIVKLGGTYTRSLNTSINTHLIAGKGEGAKYDEAVRVGGVVVVSGRWVEECERVGRLVGGRGFEVLEGQEDLDDEDDEDEDGEDERAAAERREEEGKRKNEIRRSKIASSSPSKKAQNKRTPTPTPTKPKPTQPIISKYTTTFNRALTQPTKPLFINHTFYMPTHSHTSKSTNELTALIRRNYGTRVWNLNPSITHVVIDTTLESGVGRDEVLSIVKRFKCFSSGPVVVSDLWVVECCRDGGVGEFKGFEFPVPEICRLEEKEKEKRKRNGEELDAAGSPMKKIRAAKSPSPKAKKNVTPLKSPKAKNSSASASTSTPSKSNSKPKQLHPQPQPQPQPQKQLKKLNKNHIISLSGYTGNERNDIIKAIEATGAVFTPSLTRNNTELICSNYSDSYTDVDSVGSKFKKAVEWGVDVWNDLWLYADANDANDAITNVNGDSSNSNNKSPEEDTHKETETNSDDNLNTVNLLNELAGVDYGNGNGNGDGNSNVLQSNNHNNNNNAYSGRRLSKGSVLNSSNVKQHQHKNENNGASSGSGKRTSSGNPFSKVRGSTSGGNNGNEDDYEREMEIQKGLSGNDVEGSQFIGWGFREM